MFWNVGAIRESQVAFLLLNSIKTWFLFTNLTLRGIQNTVLLFHPTH